MTVATGPVQVTSPDKAAALVDGLTPADVRPEWIDWVQSTIEDYIGFPFSADGTVDESLDGDGSEFIFLSERPVLAVQSLSIFGVPIPTQSYRLYGPPGYIRVMGTRLSQFDAAPFPNVPRGPQTVRCVYTVDPEVTGRIEMAASMMVAAIANTRRRGTLGVGSIGFSVGEVRVNHSNHPVMLQQQLMDIMKQTIPRKNAAYIGGWQPPRQFSW